MANNHSIPVELYRPILSYLNLPSLLAVSTVSHTLHFESQRIIYASIDLHQRSPSQIRVWAETIAGDARLARLVRTLVLPEAVALDINIMEAVTTENILASALKVIVNLVELTIIPHQRSRISYFNLGMFEGCLFRLKKFHNWGKGDLYHHDGMSSQFLIEQTEIRDWMPDFEIRSDPDFASDFTSFRIFPHLEKVHLRDPKLLPILNQRPLTSITIDTTRYRITELEAFWVSNILGVYHRNLVELRFIMDRTMEDWWWEPMNVVEHIPEKLPMLKVLGYSQLSSNSTALLPYLLQVLPRFKHLTTIIIDLPSTASLTIQRFGTIVEVTNNESIAQLIFDACPSLSRVTFSSSSQWFWEEGRCPTFRRDGEGEEGFVGAV